MKKAFTISIPETRLTRDGVTWTYGILVITDEGIQWTVFRRFSEFHSLAERLNRTWGLHGVPQPPPKMLGRPQSPTRIEERRSQLCLWLQSVCKRADLRTCPALLDFLEWEVNVGGCPQSLAPSLDEIRTEGRFFLTHARYFPPFLFAGYEETAVASRIVWSLVERETLGSISILQYDPSIQRSSECQSLHIWELIRHDGPDRVKDVFYHPLTGRMFCALDSGHLSVYRVPQQIIDQSSTAAEYQSISPESQLNLHAEAILHLSGSHDGPGRLLTVSLDKTIRIINCSTLETLCGGRLEKRLDPGDYLTVGELEPSFDQESFESSRVFVGTHSGRVLILTSLDNPPHFLAEIPGPKGIAPITALKSVGSNLLVAQQRTLFVFKIGKGQPTIQLIHTLESPLTSGRTIKSVAIALSSPLLFVGHQGGCISVWDCSNGKCVSCFKAHSNAVNDIHCVEEVLPQGTITRLITAGREAEIRLWNVPDPTGLTQVWPDEEEEHSNSIQYNQPIETPHSQPTSSEQPFNEADSIANSTTVDETTAVRPSYHTKQEEDDNIVTAGFMQLKPPPKHY